MRPRGAHLLSPMFLVNGGGGGQTGSIVASRRFSPDHCRRLWYFLYKWFNQIIVDSIVLWCRLWVSIMFRYPSSGTDVQSSARVSQTLFERIQLRCWFYLIRFLRDCSLKFRSNHKLFIRFSDYLAQSWTRAIRLWSETRGMLHARSSFIQLLMHHLTDLIDLRLLH